MNADLHMADELKNTGKGNLFVIFGEPDIDILPFGEEGAGSTRIQVKISGVDVFHPTTGEVRSDGADGIACWFIDTDYNEESVAPQRHLASVRPPGVGPHRRQGHQPPRRRGDEGVPGVNSQVTIRWMKCRPRSTG